MAGEEKRKGREIEGEVREIHGYLTGQGFIDPNIKYCIPLEDFEQKNIII